ncbi:hypothetical protein DY000_02023953 [Brassica cretica]|uniref:Transmembrane protein n=1 Tax=Brassica cretica TaxID=69181 RepID=A0ABQ7EMR2_BRACR|nr:hypothetical protein DY000_02023953 [Brassica cretica]
MQVAICGFDGSILVFEFTLCLVCYSFFDLEESVINDGFGGFVSRVHKVFVCSEVQLLSLSMAYFLGKPLFSLATLPESSLCTAGFSRVSSFCFGSILSVSLFSLSLSIRRRRFAGSEESSVHIDRSFNLGIESAPGPRSLGLGFHCLFLLSLSTGTSAAVVYSRPSRLSSFSGWKPSPPSSPTCLSSFSVLR